MIKIKSHPGDQYQLSRTNINKTWSRIAGFILILWGIGLLIILFRNDSPASDSFRWLHSNDVFGYLFVGCFSILIFLFGILFLVAKEQNFEDTEFHYYSPLSKVLQALRILLVMIVFIGPFTLLLVSMEDDSGFKLFGLIVLGIFWIVSIFLGADVIKKFNSFRKFGKSLLVTDRKYYRLGDTVKVTLVNTKLNETHIQFQLKNLMEYWDNKSNDESSTLIHQTLYQENKSGIPDQPAEFTIPKNEKVKTTSYDYSRPLYWSVEAVNDDIGYYSQFIINVWD